MAHGDSEATDRDMPALTGRHLAAGFCAWLVPGLGHWVLGQRSRAVILAVGIGSLWLGGVLLGGVGVQIVEFLPA